MQALRVDDIREKFLAYFQSKEHLRIPSFSLVPRNDASLLLINSGMAPLKPYFTGQEIPPNKRVATCQKCIRTVDIDEVGRDARHGSFFEMLGNFSFGDYFKKEIIPWAWAFLTEELQLPADRLYITVYEDDNEAYQIWQDDVGIPAERIFRMGKKDNFWEHGVGPCGPCSEIHYDKGEAFGCGKPDCTIGCDCDRYMEIWNLVFTQFNKLEDGNYTQLDFCNIDTGMGLERLATVLQGVNSIFDIDNIAAIREKVRALTGGYDQPSVNIITDHARSVTFMAADGVLPSNEGRGYVLRRLLRRAIRHGKLLGRDEPFIASVCQTVIDVSANAYPELAEKQDYILKVLSLEESKFMETLDTGMNLLREQITRLQAEGQKILSGENAFRLYDTYGFPLELMREILADEGVTPDEEGFLKQMQAQRERARAARGVSTYMGAEETVYHQLSPALETIFVGYTETEAEAEVTALIADQAVAEIASEGQSVSVFLTKTPFYAESGGQKGDTGILEWPGGLVEVQDCIKVVGGKTAHIGVLKKGTLQIGVPLTARVSTDRRLDTARHHTATHLLQKALRDVLGAHVEQAGSDVSAQRLRFDFTHFTAVSPEELHRVENQVNQKIMAGLPVHIQELTLEEARQKGAMALFGEKYGETVRMVDIGGYSLELCGGTHVTNTAQIGPVKILSENGVAAGTRRIEALAGNRALAWFAESDALLQAAASAAKTTPDKLEERILALLAENKAARQEIEGLKAKLAGGSVEALLQAAENFKGFTMVSARMDGMDMNNLRTLGDRLKEKVTSGVVVLASVRDGATQFLVLATDDAVKKGVHAGQIAKAAAEICGGNGGGRPNMAQAGGKNAEKADEVLKTALDMAKAQLG